MGFPEGWHIMNQQSTPRREGGGKMKLEIDLDKIKFTRKFAMPSKNTFNIKPIGEFIKKYLMGISIDPFSGDNELCTFTNDLNPKTPAKYHMDAENFINMLKGCGVIPNVVIFDPPYSPRQISECYKGIGLKVEMKETQNGLLYKRVRDVIDQIVPIEGRILSFGWNSCGMGKTRGYVIEEILLVYHGGAHNDTICLCERKGLIK